MSKKIFELFNYQFMSATAENRQNNTINGGAEVMGRGIKNALMYL